ncbi:MAG: MarR family transcriptional regulator [Chloroflexi bacterium]|nr:MarR family transcriptional regulator [Chloroflexota bacterium]
MTGDYTFLLEEILRAGDRILARMEVALAQHGLSVPKYKLLTLLAEAEDSRLPLSVMAEKLSCARSNVTGLIDRLEAEGLVKRSSSHDDRRVTYAQITAAGQVRLAAAHPAYQAALTETLAGLSFAEREALMLFLQKMGAA